MDCSLKENRKERVRNMSKQGFGTLANLAQILEEASNPESQVREDRREIKPKTLQKASSSVVYKKIMDPKRKAWYERRLKEQADARQASSAATTSDAPAVPTHTATRAAAANVSGGLLSVLASAKEAKPKDNSRKPEAWKRKPGDPIF